MNSFIIETEPGELVVFDGGYREECEHLLEKLRLISGKNKPSVAGWFLTHPHMDHIDCFKEIVEKYSELIEIKHVYYNFPSVQFMEKYGYEPQEAKTLREFYELLPLFADRAVIVTEGDIYEIGGAFEILYSMNPAWTNNAGNNASMVIRLTLGESTIMFLADMGEEAGEQLLLKYGEGLKCDYCQMAHHGQNGVNKEVYEAISPKVCIWCTPDWLWDNDLGEGYDTACFNTIKVQEWMKELGVETHYVMKDGDQVIEC